MYIITGNIIANGGMCMFHFPFGLIAQTQYNNQVAN